MTSFTLLLAILSSVVFSEAYFAEEYSPYRSSSVSSTHPYIVNVFASTGGPTHHCHGVIISDKMVVTAASSVAGYSEIIVTTTLLEDCPQEIIGEQLVPKNVYIHRDYLFELTEYIALDDYYLKPNLAVLEFELFTFLPHQIIELHFGKCGVGNLQAGTQGYTFDCTVDGFIKKEVTVRSYEDAATQYLTLDAVPPNIFVTYNDDSQKCVGCAGTPLIIDEKLAGILSYCRSSCTKDTEIFTSFLDLSYFYVPITQTLKDNFFPLSVINEKLIHFTADQRNEARKSLDFYGAREECNINLYQYKETFGLKHK